jgi:hypothetical protein
VEYGTHPAEASEEGGQRAPLGQHRSVEPEMVGRGSVGEGQRGLSGCCQTRDSGRSFLRARQTFGDGFINRRAVKHRHAGPAPVV